MTSRSSVSSPSASALFYIQEPTEETANSEGVFQPPHSGAPGQDTAEFFSGASQHSDFKSALDDLLHQQQQQQRSNKNLDTDGKAKSTSQDVTESSLIFLFVGQYHAEQFEAIVEYAQTKLVGTVSLEDSIIPTNNIHKHRQFQSKKDDMEVVVMLGGGVIGGGEELDNSQTPAMTILSGRLPQKYLTVFQNEADDEDNELPEAILAEIESDTALLDVKTQTTEEPSRPPSYMVFSDPFAPLNALLHRLDAPSYNNPAMAPPVVAGGVTVPHGQQRVPSIARNGRMLPAGSLVGIAFTGNVGLMAIVAQGCRPVGPTFVITEASNTILTGLSGKSAVEQLEQVAEHANEQDKELIRNGEFVCGIGTTNSAMVDIASIQHDCLESNDSNNAGETDNMETIMVNDEDEGASDFLIRQIKGYQPKRGSIVVAAGGLKEGSTFRFHVRAAKSAQEDMELMIQRAKTERLFAGSSTLFKTGPGALSVAKGKPLAAFQLSCVARGSEFYGSPNVDLKKVEGLFSDNESNPNAKPPVAGFFANGEIGPVGIRMAEMAAKDAEQQDDRTSSNTFLHGFTTVIAMLCDYSDTNTSAPTEKLSTDGIMDSSHDAWA